MHPHIQSACLGLVVSSVRQINIDFVHPPRSMLIVKIEDADINLTLWKWSKDDFKIPLRITLPDSTALIYLDDPDRWFSSKSEPSARPRRRLQWVMHSTMFFQFDNPSDDLKQGLAKPRSDKAEEAARRIHANYLKCREMIMTYCRLELGVLGIIETGASDLDDLFQGRFGRQTNVSWSLDGETFIPFTYKPKRVRGNNPAFRSKLLVKPSDWIRLQKVISKGQIPPAEVTELLKLRSKALWRGERRVSIVESAAIIEMALKDVVSSSLLQRGLSKARLDSLREEAGLSIFLNFMLPLGLSNAKYRHVLPLIQKIDRLRKLRNQIMHDNLAEKDIDEEEAHEGIDACIKLMMYLMKIGKWLPSVQP